MTTPFWCLFIAAVLPYVWGFAGVPARKQQLGSIDNKYPRRQQAQLEGYGARALGAHQNAFEALAVFAPAVIVAHLANADAASAARLAEVWVVSRVVHGLAYLANVDLLRSLAFLVAFGCAIGLFVIAARAA